MSIYRVEFSQKLLNLEYEYESIATSTEYAHVYIPLSTVNGQAGRIKNF